jgi:hypothetical protein
MFMDNVAGITLDEALDSAGGLRSILGLLKHTAAWTDRLPLVRVRRCT